MVNNKTIDAKILSRMFLAGAKNLEAKKEWINELNVFPVPDGDTGTNMTLTIMSAASEVGALADPDMETLAKAISSGSLRGARGNSGVILSQLLRGFTRGVRKLTDLDAPAIAVAMERGVETAYKAVMKPKEGTILTVARAAADRALELADSASDLDTFFDGIFQHAEETLARTPEMLPVLKEAGVVDSGGQGLLEVFRGAIDGYHGKEVDYSQFEASAAPKITKISPQAEADIKFGYCTEFIILLEKPLPQEEISRFREFLDSIGDSIVLVADDEIVKVHVHTNHPGQAFERALTYGQLSRMKIDNMREEHQEKLIKDAEKLAREQAEKEKEPPKDHGFISVSVGEGLSQIFRELGVDYLIEGGQTMNPSTKDLLDAANSANADNVIILPNNSNIIMAAQSAAELAEMNCGVVPTKSVPQAFAAMFGFDESASLDENVDAMTESFADVKTGEVTTAIKDSKDAHDNPIVAGDVIGIADGSIEAVGHSVAEVVLSLLDAMEAEDADTMTILAGADFDDEALDALVEKIEEKFDDLEIDQHRGDQPLYPVIFSVE